MYSINTNSFTLNKDILRLTYNPWLYRVCNNLSNLSDISVLDDAQIIISSKTDLWPGQSIVNYSMAPWKLSNAALALNTNLFE